MSAEVEEQVERDEQLPPEARPIRMPRALVAASEFSWRFIVCVAAVAAFVFALTKVAFAVIPVFIAILLATLLVPLVARLRQRGVPNVIATTLVFVTAVAALAGLVALLAPSVASEFELLPDQVRLGADRLAELLAEEPFSLNEVELQQQIDDIEQRITENQGAITSGVLSGAQIALQLATGLLVTLVITFFFVKDGRSIWGWVVRLFPERRRDSIEQMGGVSWKVLGAYVRGVAFVALFDAVAIGLALLAIGVPLVLPLAVLTFFAAFIPLVGAFVAGLAAGLVALAFEGVAAMLLVGVAIVLIQQIEGNFLYPLVVGRTVELHPVAILLAVTVGGVLAGIVGAAIAVPIAAVGSGVIQVVRRTSEPGEVAVGPQVALTAAGAAGEPAATGETLRAFVQSFPRPARPGRSMRVRRRRTEEGEKGESPDDAPRPDA